jgi:hypothetical protein
MILPTEHSGGSSSERFALGELVATAAAMAALTQADIQTAIRRHLSGDWGDLDKEDVTANETALEKGRRLLSVYYGANKTKFYVITEWDRSLTTVLLPSDY